VPRSSLKLVGFLGELTSIFSDKRAKTEKEQEELEENHIDK